MSVHTTEEIDRVVLEFLATRDNGPAPERDDDLFQSGRVNSLFAIQLMSFIERAFDIEVDVEDLSLTNFASIAKITGFVQSKQLETQTV
ncbi:phosphopantetheine-binding protein [Streptomyces sp. SL13]|uniref:Phosphopantetheine-binding protein n=1 Tax=Streptantibioticus silvisoli TaxID=2705255 RepID=A0AA90H5P5_9ACTN|nr:phosphopantetheine-binding protein [Streptantibioticus silvisoli]MDI5968587.1 phosphopantetheine-binding protein [Streptantibioticus silvisoli]